MIREITDEEFDEVIGVDFSVVKFYADWCKPCKLLDPIIDELSNELTNFNFYKINIDENPYAVESCNVLSVPTVNVYYNGEMISSQIGAKAKVQMKKFITESQDMV
jgi:thioredoxin 1